MASFNGPRQRLTRIRNDSEISSGYFARPPAVTYGRRIKPLPLTGTHFRARDPYTIPPDSDDEPESPKTKTSRSRVRQPDPDDSPLSEDELEAVYGRNASPIQSSPEIHTSSSKTSVERPVQKPSRRSVNERTGIPQIARQSPQQQIREEERSMFKKCRTVAQDSRGGKVPSQRPKKKLPVPARRLPVNELVLVTSPAADQTSIEPPSSSVHAEQKSDPIAESSQSGHHHAESPSEDGAEDQNATRAPLTSMRKRLKTPKFTHKSVVALRKKQNRHKRGHRDIGDGFEAEELQVDRRLKFRKSNKSTKSLLLGFSALNLQAGPLPDVKFEDCSSELKLESNVNREEESLNGIDQPVQTIEDPRPDPDSPRLNRRRVGFSDRVLDEMIMQQLSSISAPKRVYSISSDHSDDEQEDFEVTDDEEEDEEEEEEDEDREDEEQSQADDEAEAASPRRPRAPTPPSNQRARQHSRFWRRCSSPRQSSPVTPASVNHGVSLDFRKHHGLAQPPTPFGKRKLMEVDDTIYDEPAVDNGDDEMLDDRASPEVVPEPVPPVPSRTHGPRRSILRQTPWHRQDSDHFTRPEDTEANTRRNSVILDEQSRYSTTASDMLQHREGRPRILKHRSSELRRRRSGYLDETKGVQVLDSEARVLEMSPGREKPDYTNFTNLDVLKRSSDAVRTSSQSLLRGEPRDLKTLTRTVSRQYGTTGQGLSRRRPSLPFQSPTKVRRD